MGSRLITGLESVAEETTWIGELRGRGLMIALEIVNHDGDRVIPDPHKAGELLEACKDNGILVGKAGVYGNVIRIAPMLTVTEEEIDSGVSKILKAIHSIL